MQEEMKDVLAETVRSATAVLDDEEALAILEICKRAIDRGIADVTEQYLAECINGNGMERGEEDGYV